MFIFLWVLASMGVAYWAKLDGRNPALWFTASVLLSPLAGSVALMLADRWRRR